MSATQLRQMLEALVEHRNAVAAAALPVRRPRTSTRAATVALVFCFAVCAASCTPPPPQDFALCPPSFQSQVLQFNVIPLDSYIDSDHVLRVGNGSSVAIPQGTRIFFTAKLVNAGPYCATVLAPEPILPHLYVRILGQPLFDYQAQSQAWRIAPLVNQ